MVDKDFIDSLKRALSAVELIKGEVSLFGIFKMDEYTDKWTLILSAAWFEQTQFNDVFTILREKLLENIGENTYNIARIGIFNLEDHFTTLVLKSYRTDDLITSDQQINGNLVHEGYIIKAINV